MKSPVQVVAAALPAGSPKWLAWAAALYGIGGLLTVAAYAFGNEGNFNPKYAWGKLSADPATAIKYFFTWPAQLGWLIPQLTQQVIDPLNPPSGQDPTQGAGAPIDTSVSVKEPGGATAPIE